MAKRKTVALESSKGNAAVKVEAPRPATVCPNPELACEECGRRGIRCPFDSPLSPHELLRQQRRR
jgi:hypothetical protein